jgi:hypothetical protein
MQGKLAVARRGMKWEDNINTAEVSGDLMCHTI